MVILLSAPLSAQVIAGRAAALNLSSISMGTTVSRNQTADVFFGANKKGPYVLSWKPINKFSDKVTVNGDSVQPTLDYTIDYAGGTITFNDAINSTQVVRVEYGCNFATATQNANAVSMPVQLDLVSSASSTLKFSADYSAGAQANGSAMSAYGLSGTAKTKMGDFTTMFMASPTSGDQNSSAMGRSALKLAGTTKAGMLQLDTSYSHVGQGFASAKNYNLQQGVDAMSIGATLSPSKGLNLISSFKRSESLYGSNEGQVDTSSEQKLAFSANSRTKVSLGHSQTDTEKAGETLSAVTKDQLRVEQNLSSKLSAVASVDSVSTTVDGATTRVTTDSFSVAAKPSDSLSMKTQFTQKDSSSDGGQQNIAFNVDASPNKRLSVKAAMNLTDSDKSGKDNSQTIAVAAAPSDRVSLNVNVAHGTSDLDGNELSHDIKLVAKPRDDTKFEFGLKGMATDTSGDNSTTSVKVQTSAVKNTTVQANWAQSESTSSGTELNSGIRVDATPISAIKLSGSVAQKETSSAQQLTRKASLEVTPFSGTKLGGAYSEVAQSGGVVLSRTTEVNATTQPVKFLALSGGYKNRLGTQVTDPDTMNIAVKLNPAKLFSLTSAYAMNPEDSSGTVQRFNSRSFGLSTNLGKLSLKGAYTWKDEYLIGHRVLMTQLGADFRFSAHSILTTSYSLEEDAQDFELLTHIYALTFSHQVGTQMNVYLTGKAKLLEKDQQFVADQSEYEAEARLGMKF
jgi:hypothetical protein